MGNYKTKLRKDNHHHGLDEIIFNQEQLFAQSVPLNKRKSKKLLQESRIELSTQYKDIN
jgi:hypothetical protein